MVFKHCLPDVVIPILVEVLIFFFWAPRDFFSSNSVYFKEFLRTQHTG